jgi:hypothetical protein
MAELLTISARHSVNDPYGFIFAMSKRKENLAESPSTAHFPIRVIKLTAKQEAARKRMLGSPCPYCSHPKKFQQPLSGEGRADHASGIARVGKFWARDEPNGMLLVTSYDHGEYFSIPIKSKHFIPRFKDFSLNIISFESGFSPWVYASDALLFGLSAAPSDITRFNKFSLNVARVTHKKSAVVVDTHTWFSHGTLLTVHHVPSELSSADITVMQEALEFFRPETRGAPKIKRADMWAAVKKLGSNATQPRVAAELKVGESTIGAWLKRERITWAELKSQFHT